MDTISGNSFNTVALVQSPQSRETRLAIHANKFSVKWSAAITGPPHAAAAADVASDASKFNRQTRRRSIAHWLAGGAAWWPKAVEAVRAAWRNDVQLRDKRAAASRPRGVATRLF